MRTLMKAVIGASVIIIVSLIITLLMLIYYKISLDPVYNYISTIASLIVILLMLITIISTENSSKEHINSLEDATRKQIESWELIHRKQSIKSLIKESKLNMTVYEDIKVDSQKEDKSGKFNNFILTSLEKCLYNSPIENEKINHNLLLLYYIMKIHDNKLTATRTANITKESLSSFINSIATNYEENKKIFEITLKMVEDYEQNLKDL